MSQAIRKYACFFATVGILVMAALFAAPADSRSVEPAPGTWTGTAGPFALHFEVGAGGSEISHLGTNYNPATFCGVPTSEIDVHFPSFRVQGGGFHATTSLGGPEGEHFSIEGKFTSPREATGTISGHFKIKNNALPPCHASSPFKAKPENR